MLSTNAVAAVIAPVTPLQAVATADSSGGTSAAAGTGATQAIAAIGSGAAAGAQAAAGQKPATPLPTAPTPSSNTEDGETAPPAAGTAAGTGTTAQAQLAAGIASATANTDAQNAAGPHAPAHSGTDTTVSAPNGGTHTDAAATDPTSQPTTFAANLAAQAGPAAPANNGQAAAATLQPLAAAATGAAATAGSAAPAGAAAAPAQTAATNAAAIPFAAVPVEITAQAKAGSNRFEIRLDPPDLGRIDVQLNVDKAGNVTSHLVADRSSTLDMLRRDAPQLQRALQDAGLKTNSDTLQFSLRDQGANAQGQQQGFQNNGSTRTATIAVPTDDVQPVETARSYGRLYGATGGLDIRV